jgi:putative endonuclease
MDVYVVYILASRSRVLYIGITSRLQQRIWKHRNKAVPGFTAKYNVDRLVHYEIYNEPYPAIAREKQLKGWRRSRKVALIEAENPEWRDLYDEI